MPTILLHKDESDLMLGPVAIGLRLMQARKLSNLSRRQLEDKYQLKATTLKSWETGRYNGLTEKGTKLILSILEQEHVLCSREWLLFGKGLGPRLQACMLSSNNTQQELDFFLQQHTHVLYYQIQRDTLPTGYKPLEIVAGPILPHDNLSQALGCDCLILDKDQQYAIGQLKQRSRTFFLQCLKDTQRSITSNTQIAPIIWRRQPWPPETD